MYWFNPIDIILDELLAGATIALPSNIVDALDLVRKASHWMFALFLTGACLTVPSIFLSPLSVFSRWASLPLSLLTFCAAFATTAASIIASAMFIIFRNEVNKAIDTVNIEAAIGTKMFALMWIAAGAAIDGKAKREREGLRKPWSRWGMGSRHKREAKSEEEVDRSSPVK
ncbi:MAG: hypothetical protein Q9207_000046 [Kuettlingeria erythrocarpa]